MKNVPVGFLKPEYLSKMSDDYALKDLHRDAAMTKMSAAETSSPSRRREFMDQAKTHLQGALKAASSIQNVRAEPTGMLRTKNSQSNPMDS